MRHQLSGYGVHFAIYDQRRLVVTGAKEQVLVSRAVDTYTGDAWRKVRLDVHRQWMAATLDNGVPLAADIDYGAACAPCRFGFGAGTGDGDAVSSRLSEGSERRRALRAWQE